MSKNADLRLINSRSPYGVRLRVGFEILGAGDEFADPAPRHEFELPAEYQEIRIR